MVNSLITELQPGNRKSKSQPTNYLMQSIKLPSYKAQILYSIVAGLFLRPDTILNYLSKKWLHT